MKFQKLDIAIPGCNEIQLPRMIKVRQRFNTPTVEDVQAELKTQLMTNLNSNMIDGLRGKTIGITAGSRGLPYYKEILKTLVNQLLEWGADPFIFPAMGSHGGGTAEGQKAFLAQYGITEEYLNVPIKSSMEVVEVTKLEDGMSVYCDKYAAEADGIVIFNKVKPHTHFKDIHESGLLKMICIGVGKHLGAVTFHHNGMDHFCEDMVRCSKAFLENVNVVFSVGMIQNAYDLIGKIEVVPTEKFFEKDAELLALAKSEMARFKFDDIDVLVIDEIGKNISGMGADPNITGRTEVLSQQQEFRNIAPSIKQIVLLDLSEHTHGNATGMGDADYISYRLANKIDFASTYINAITSGFVRGAGGMPLYCSSDLEAIRLALITARVDDFSKARMVRIKNTLMLEEFEVSEAFLEEFQQRDDIDVLSDPVYWDFNKNENLW